MDVGTYMLPFVGSVRSTIEFFAGRNMITGEKLSEMEKWLGLGMALIGGAGVARGLAHAMGEAGKAAEAARGLSSVGRDLGKGLGKEGLQGAETVGKASRSLEREGQALGKAEGAVGHALQEGEHVGGRAVGEGGRLSEGEIQSESRLAEGEAGAGGACSFDQNTPVATDQGEEPIGQLKLGDRVLAYDQSQNVTGYYTVTAILVNHDPAIEHLTIEGETLTTTPEHPFFTQEEGWVAAGVLQVGHHIKKANGDYGAVEAVKIEQRPQTMYNLTVAQAHTFFVGHEQWLVHNTCRVEQDGNLHITRNSQNRPIEVRAYLKPDYFQDWGTAADAIAQRRAVNYSTTTKKYEAGHLLARLFGGPGEWDSGNIIPLLFKHNRSGFKLIENRIAQLLKDGFDVSVMR